MRSNCQLHRDERHFGRSSAARERVSSPTGSPHCPAPTPDLHPHRRLRDAVPLALFLLAACGGGHNDSDEAGSDDDTRASNDDDAGDDGTTDFSDTDNPTTGTDEAGTDDTGGGEVGPNFGLLTFTFYPADASDSPAQLGMAGAWRTEPFTTDDFYAVRSLALYFPPPPAKVDTLEVHDLSVYDWGKADAWVTLGNGLRLTSAGADALACLQVVEDTYPVYLSDDAPFFDPACAPDPAQWQPATAYDLTAYGGETFADQTRKAALTTPGELTVTAPAIDVFDFPLEKAKDLAVTWTADDETDDRIVIRVWDQFGRQLVVHAGDDGSYTIAGSELSKLAAGPATITVARERSNDLGLAAGTLHLVARTEVWAYPDLF